MFFDDDFLTFTLSDRTRKSNWLENLFCDKLFIGSVVDLSFVSSNLFQQPFFKFKFAEKKFLT